MLIQEKKNIFDLKWSNNGNTYKDICLINEVQQSYYNFDFKRISDEKKDEMTDQDLVAISLVIKSKKVRKKKPSPV